MKHHGLKCGGVDSPKQFPGKGHGGAGIGAKHREGGVDANAQGFGGRVKGSPKPGGRKLRSK